MGKNLVALTHVCRRWREVLTPCSSLWTCLDCKNTDKTRVFLERSRSLPLEIALCEYGSPLFVRSAFRLVIPHINRVVSLRIEGSPSFFQTYANQFSRPFPLLRHLVIHLSCSSFPVLNGTLFNGDLSSLCTLSLSGVIPHVPWKNLSKLNTFLLHSSVAPRISAMRLLDFFENSPLLSQIVLLSIPDSSDAHPGRLVSLPCLKDLTISAGMEPSSVLLDHLSIPAGASLHLKCEFNRFSRFNPPLRTSIPETVNNIRDVSCITLVYIYLGRPYVSIRLNGGGLYIHGHQHQQSNGNTEAILRDRRILRSLSYLPLPRVQALAVTTYEFPKPKGSGKPSPYRILHAMKDLHTLFLNRCNNLPFISILNPDRGTSSLIPCPKLGTLILYVEWNFLGVEELMNTARERVLKGVGLRSIMVVSHNGRVPGNDDVLKLKDHVAHVECKVGEGRPKWDKIPDYGNNCQLNL